MPARRVTVNGRDQIDPRHTRAWRTLRDQVVKEEPLCRLRIRGVCTGASETADHIVPVVERPELALERTNLRGACTACNDTRRSSPDEAFATVDDAPAERPPALSIFD